MTIQEDPRRLRGPAGIAAFVALSIGLAIATPIAVLELRSDLHRPVERVYGEVEHLHAVRHSSRSRPRVSLKLDTYPRWLTWNCWALGCRPYDALLKLQDAPWPMAEAYRIGDHLVGLKINGRTYLQADAERARLIRGEAEQIVLLAGLAAVMALIASQWFAQRARRYRAPDPADARRIRSLMPGRGLAKTRSRS